MTKFGAFNWLLRVFVTMFLISATLYIYATRIERPYLSYQNLPFPPLLERVRPGEIVPLSVERCSSAKVIKAYRTTHALRNVKTRELEIQTDVQVTIDPGCHRGVSKINLIPLGTKPGIYTAVGIATVEGAFTKHEVPWYSEPFEVIP